MIRRFGSKLNSSPSLFRTHQSLCVHIIIKNLSDYKPRARIHFINLHPDSQLSVRGPQAEHVY